MKKLILFIFLIGTTLLSNAQFTFKDGGGTVDVYTNGTLKTSFQKSGLTVTYAGDVMTLRQDTKRSFTYQLTEIDTPAYSTMDSIVSTISGWLATYGGTYWANSGNYIYPTTLTDSVGIGTATPSALLEVNGRSEINAIKSDTIYSNITVKDSTDITDEINTYLASNDVLRLPQGLFYLSDTISINRDNIRIIGAGENKTILKNVTEGVVRFIGSTTNNLEISNLTLRGSSHDLFSVFIHTQFEIQDITYLNLNKVIVDSCEQISLYALKLIDCFKYNIENCNFMNNNVRYTLWSDANSGTYSNISNSYFMSNYSTAIRIDKRDMNITNNFFWGNGGNCIWLNGSSVSEFSASKSNISNNIINHSGNGIQVSYGYYDNITNNNFHDNDGYAIYLRGTQNYNISNNIIKQNGNITGDPQIIMATNGTYNCSGNIITGNQIIRTSGISPYAIYGDSAQQNNIISNNTINAHYGGTYYDVDSNNFIFENNLIGSSDTNYVQNTTYFINNIDVSDTITTDVVVTDRTKMAYIASLATGTNTLTTTAADTYYTFTGWRDTLSINTTTTDSTITINSGGEGYYQITCDMSFTYVSSKTLHRCLFVNDVEIYDFGESSRKLGVNNDVGSASFNTIIYLSAGDVLKIKIRGNSAGGTFTAIYGQFNIHRIY